MASIRLRQMPFHVQSQMVGPSETPVACIALKRFSAGMFSVVARQFVRTRESPVATRPMAQIWFFTFTKIFDYK